MSHRDVMAKVQELSHHSLQEIAEIFLAMERNAGRDEDEIDELRRTVGELSEALKIAEAQQ